jgi:L-threonylcarbamoyladenylate synthase
MKFEDDIKESLKVLKEGGVILYPTDTIWGLGCDATNAEAVNKLLKLKSRTGGKSLIVLVDNLSMLGKYVREIPEVVYQLMSVSDSPMTIIYPDGRNLAEGVCADDGSVGIRICNEKFCNELIRRFSKPIVSTSANKTHMPTPSNFSEIDEAVIRSVDYTVSYRQDDLRKYSASSVIKVERNGVFKIIRK